MQSDRKRLLALIREYYTRIAWTHKILEKDREILLRTTNIKKWVNIGILSITSTGVITTLLTDNFWIKIATAITSVVSTAYAIYELSFSPETEILSYRNAAKELLVERDKALLLIEMAMDEQRPTTDVRDKYEEMVERVSNIYKTIPDTTNKAYKLAADSLKLKEDLTFSDEEIDHLLPSELRISKPSTSQTLNP